MSRSEGGAEQSDPGHDGGYAEWVGRVLDGRYRIDGLLGEGGMGAVFVGEHLKLMKKVAIKVIHPEFAGDGDVAERFAREAVAAGQMDHPHVASATDYGTLAEGGAYLVMQYVRGGSLRDLLEEEGAVGWVRACEIGAQVADALSAAHSKGYVHRDLKPDNIMLEPRDDGSRLVKVLDFGIARVASEKAVGGGGRTLTRVGTVIGTPGYMAPEQALGEPVDYRADLYALGLVVHEMVSGTPVYDQKELTAIVTRQLTESPPRLGSVADGVPVDLDELVAHLLERDKEKRPQSAAEVREELKNLVLGAKLHAVASGEHELPTLGPTELAGAAGREPTPLGVPLGSRKSKAVTPPAGSATVGATPRVKGAIPTPIKRATSVATAKTALALEQVKAKTGAAGLPLVALGLGCAGLVAMVGLIAGAVAIFGGDDPAALVKHEHVAPLPERDSDEEDEAAEVAVPDVLAQPMADLMLSDEQSARRSASRAVLDHQPREDVPAFLIAVAELEDARSCRQKQAQVVHLRELGDPRALPALERIDAEPTDGCRRFFRRYDCYQCLRGELATTLSSLRARMND